MEDLTRTLGADRGPGSRRWGPQGSASPVPACAHQVPGTVGAFAPVGVGGQEGRGHRCILSSSICITRLQAWACCFRTCLRKALSVQRGAVAAAQGLGESPGAGWRTALDQAS